MAKKQATSTPTPAQPATPRVATLPSFLGGGAYKVVPGQPNKLVTDKRSQDAIPAKKGQERDHIVSVAAGGVSAKDNLRYVPNTAGTQSGQLEKDVMADYRAGKISLPQARLKILTAKQKESDEANGVNANPLSLTNIWGGLKEAVANPVESLQKAIPAKAKAEIKAEAKKVGKALLSSIASNPLVSDNGNNAVSVTVKALDKARQNSENKTVASIAKRMNYSKEDAKKAFDTLNNIGGNAILGSGAASGGKKILEDVLKTKKTVTPAAADPAGAVLKDIKTAVKKNIKPKESGFVSHIKNSPQSSKAIQSRVSGEYIPRSTDELSIKAKNLIKDDIETAHNLVSNGTDEKAVATAMELINHYNGLAGKAKTVAEKNAFYDKAAEVAHEITPKLTELGRGVQAATIYTRQSPEGIARFAASEIEKYNKTAKVKLPKLTGEQLSGFVETAKKIKGMADGVEKAMATQKLMESIQALTPSSLADKAIAVWKAGLLTGLKTTGANTISNLTHGAMETAKDAPAAAVDRLASLVTGKRTKAFTLKGIGDGATEGAQKGLRYLKTGFDERNVGAKLDFKKVNFTSKTGKALQAYEESVFRLLGAEDQPFYYAAKSRSLNDQAIAAAKTAKLKGAEYKSFIADFLNKPPNEAVETAVKDAEKAVFQNDTVLASLMGKAKNPTAKAIMDVVLPFKKTPSAVAMQLVDYSPVGVAKTIINNIGKGKFDQRTFSEGIGRGLTGTAVMAIGKALYDKGMITLSQPQNDKEAAQWELEGKKPNSILINGKWRSLNSVSPGGNLLVIGGYFAKGKGEGSTSSGIATAASGGAKSLTDQTFLKGLSGILNAINDPSRYGQSVVENTAGSIVPTIVADVAQATDPLQRQANSVPEAMQARIPGWRKSLLPKQDTFGQDLKRNSGPLGTMADPFRSSPAKSEPVTARLRSLLDAGSAATPTKVPKSLKINGQQKKLTPQERYDVQKSVGNTTKDIFSSLFGDDTFNSLDQDGQAKILSNAASDVLSGAKNKQLGNRKTNALTPVYDQVQALISQGKNDEAQQIVDGLSDADYKQYKANKSAATTAKKQNQSASSINLFLKVRGLLASGKASEAQQIIDDMTPAQYSEYKALKKSFKLN